LVEFILICFNYGIILLKGISIGFRNAFKERPDALTSMQSPIILMLQGLIYGISRSKT
jgi:hypothetical protein